MAESRVKYGSPLSKNIVNDKVYQQLHFYWNYKI